MTMPTLGHGLLFLGVMLFATGCSTIFLHVGQGKLHYLSWCCLVMGLLMLILGLFWVIKRKNPQLPVSSAHETRRVLFFRRNRRPTETQSVSLPRTPSRARRGAEEDCDYPPMEPSSFSPVTRGQPYSYSWELEPPPPYEEAIKNTSSSTHLTRSCSDTLRPPEPLSGCHREVSFEA